MDSSSFSMMSLAASVASSMPPMPPMPPGMLPPHPSNIGPGSGGLSNGMIHGGYLDEGAHMALDALDPPGCMVMPPTSGSMGMVSLNNNNNIPISSSGPPSNSSLSPLNSSTGGGGTMGDLLGGPHPVSNPSAALAAVAVAAAAHHASIADGKSTSSTSMDMPDHSPKYISL